MVKFVISFHRELTWFLNFWVPTCALCDPMLRGVLSCITTITQVDTFCIHFLLYIYIVNIICNLHCLMSTSTLRFAFSCIWEMNHNAEIIKTHFTKSVINSKVWISNGFQMVFDGMCTVRNCCGFITSGLPYIRRSSDEDWWHHHEWWHHKEPAGP